MPTPLPEYCYLCKSTDLLCWGWAPDEEYDDSEDYKCNGVICDESQNSCLWHFCKECFDKHTCEGHKGNL